jgi:hypothetical protein
MLGVWAGTPSQEDNINTQAKAKNKQIIFFMATSISSHVLPS